MPAHRTIDEQQLAAAALSLLSQPQLWSALELPAASTELALQRPWTAYWAARRDQDLSPAAARALHTATLASFERERDSVGALLSIAAAIESFYIDEGSLQPMDGWIARLLEHLPEDGVWPSIELEAQVMACGLAITLRDPAHELLAHWAERGLTLLRQLRPGAVRLKLATYLLQHHLWRGEFARTSLIVDALPGLDPEGVLPTEALVWLESVATHARYNAQFAQGREAIDRALALSRRHGLASHDYALHTHAAALALADGELAAARAHVQAMRPALQQQPQEDQTHYWHMQAGLALHEGDTARALDLARMTLSNSLEIGGPYRTAAHRLSLGQVLSARGELPDALAEFDTALTIARAIDAGLLEFTLQLMRGDVLMRSGQHAPADDALRDALARGAREGYRTTSGWWMPDALSRLAARAFALGIEVEFVTRWVRLHRLPCPDADGATSNCWPWRLKVRTFGGLTIERDGKVLGTQAGKAARRPLQLLAAVAAQAPAPLSVAVAMQWLWPEHDDAAAQRKALDAAVLRLRRLLGDEQWLHLEGGRLRLDAQTVWTDVGALASLAHEVSRRNADEAATTRAQRLLETVRGPFLPDEESPWALAVRAHQRQRFSLAMVQVCEDTAQVDGRAARRLLERALDVDPAAEELAHQLIAMHAEHGDLAAAQRVLRLSGAMVHLQTGLPLSPRLRAAATRLGLSAD